MKFIHEFDDAAWHRLTILVGSQMLDGQRISGEWHGYDQPAQVTFGEHTYEVHTEFRDDPSIVREIRTVGFKAEVVQIAGRRPT